MQIRPASNKDIEGIQAVVFDVLLEYGLAADPANTDKDLKDVEHHFHHNGGYFGVIESEGAIVATLGLLRLDQDTCELRKMYALPSQRGKGLGKYLVEFAIDKARALGYRRMVLETATPLVEAIGLYKRYGFKNYKPDHLSTRCDQAFELYL